MANYRRSDDPIDLCDWCSSCEDRFKTLSDCMDTCGAPLDILEAHMRSRKQGEEDGSNREDQGYSD